jgi:hypothetical protein
VTPIYPIRRRGRLESKTGHLAVPYRLQRYDACSMRESSGRSGRRARPPSGNG